MVASGPVELMEYYIPGMANFTTDLLMSVWYAVLILMLMSLFPTGTFVPRWTRWIVLFALGLAPVYLILYIHYGSLYFSPLLNLVIPFWALTMLTAFFAQLYRYRYVSDATEREQTKWFVGAFVLWVILMLLSSIPYTYQRTADTNDIVPATVILLGLAFYVGLYPV